MSFDRPAGYRSWSLQKALVELAFLPLETFLAVSKELLRSPKAPSRDTFQRAQRRQFARHARSSDRQALRDLGTALLQVAVFSDPWDILGASQHRVNPILEPPPRTLILERGVVPLVDKAVIRLLSKSITAYCASLRNMITMSDHAVADGTRVVIVITFLPALPASAFKPQSPTLWFFNADDDLESRLSALSGFEDNMVQLCPALFGRTKPGNALSERHILETSLGLADQFETRTSNASAIAGPRFPQHHKGARTIKRLFATLRF
jgi:hypothetical protein